MQILHISRYNLMKAFILFTVAFSKFTFTFFAFSI